MKKSKRILSFLLALIVVVALMPVTALAADIIATGTCGANGDNLTWTLDSDGLLTISGTGAMADYDGTFAPWYAYVSDIKALAIENGVTTIGQTAFYNCDGLSEVVIPDGVISIGAGVFANCSNLTSAIIPDGVVSIEDELFFNCNKADHFHGLLYF